MSIYLKGPTYFYDFRIAGVRYCGNTRTDERAVAEAVEQIHKARVRGCEPEELAQFSQRSTDERFVYILKAEQTGLIKIGSTDNVERRIAHLQAGSPDRLSLIWFGAGGRRHEERAHRILKSHVSHSEWFFPTPEVMAFVETATTQGLLAAIGSIANPRALEIFNQAA